MEGSGSHLSERFLQNIIIICVREDETKEKTQEKRAARNKWISHITGVRVSISDSFKLTSGVELQNTKNSPESVPQMITSLQSWLL